MKERNITLTRFGEIKVNGKVCGRWQIGGKGVIARWQDRRGRFGEAEARCISVLRSIVKEAILAEYTKM